MPEVFQPTSSFSAFKRLWGPFHTQGTTATIPTGVAHERFKQGDDLDQERAAMRKKVGASAEATVWLMVQRLAPEKDTQKALKALADAASSGDDVHLIIVGDGPARLELEKQAALQTLPTTFLGSVPNVELPTLYRAADVFITCSISETFGLTVLEALACGLPVALPHCTVFDELWQQTLPEGWFWDPNDLPGLVRAVRVASGAPARRWLHEHPVEASWADATVELENQYEKMIKDNEETRKTHDMITHMLERWIRAILLASVLYYVCLLYLRPLRYLMVLAFFPIYRWS
jgi:glycosyltransferase involved in cell wall biosynthesis